MGTVDGSTEVDVLVVGGGVQGLTLLSVLAERGYAAVLVTNDDLGGGQTLHSHGVLNSGYAAPDPAIRTSLLEDWLPFAADRGLETYGDDGVFGVLPSAAVEQLAAAWDATGYPYEVVTPDALPPGFMEGDLFPDESEVAEERPHVVRIEEFTVPKRGLVRTLADGLADRVVRGTIGEVQFVPEDGEVAIDVVDVLVESTEESMVVTPTVMVLAAGTGTKRLVRAMVDDPSFEAAAPTPGDADRIVESIEAQLSPITHERLHMICVRGPRRILPPVNLLLAAEGTVIVTADVDEAHESVGGGETVTWYVTPQDPAWEHVEDVPDSADAEPDPSMVARGVDTAMRAFPRLREAAERPDSPVEFGVYAGYKQNVAEDRVGPMAERLAGTTNAILALPTLVGGAWLNAGRVADLIAGIAKPNGVTPTVGGAGVDVRVGHVRENRDDFEWLTWEQFSARYGARSDL